MWTSEHLHVLANHFPIIGVFAAVLTVLFGLLTKTRASLLLGFGLTVLFTAMTPVVMATGEQAMARFEEGALRPLTDQTGIHWIGVHADRAEWAAFVLYACLVISVGGLLSMWKRPRWERTAGIGVATVGAIAVLLAAWAADAGGKVRHPEFRSPENSHQTATQPHTH